MVEEIKEEVEEVQGESVEAEVSVDDKLSQMRAEMEADFAKREADYKQKISKLDKVITEKDREKLSEVERMKAEKEDIAKEKEQLQREAQEFRRKLAIDSALAEAGLPLRYANRILGDTEDEIKNDVMELKTQWDADVSSAAEERMSEKLKGKAPGKQVESGSERDQLIAQYNEAEKNGEAAKMMYLKDKISKLPK